MNKSETFMSGLYEFCTYIFCTIIASSSLITLSECLCSSDVYIQFTCLHPVLSALIALSECLCSLVLSSPRYVCPGPVPALPSLPS